MADSRSASPCKSKALACVGIITRMIGAARDTFLVTERRWRAGATNLFELEDARRQRAFAEDAAIAAARDHVQAWMALMKAIGVATALPQTSDEPDAG